MDTAVIARLVAKGKEHRPELSSRLDRAAFIAAFRIVRLVDASDSAHPLYTVESETEAGKTYAVNGRCECRDYERAPGHFCKHRLAVALIERAASDAAHANAEADAGQLVTVEKYGSRHWAVRDADGELVVVTLYKKGAAEAARRLNAAAGITDLTTEREARTTRIAITEKGRRALALAEFTAPFDPNMSVAAVAARDQLEGAA